MQDIDPSLRGPPPADATLNCNGEYRAPYDPPVFTPNPNGHDDYALNGNLGDDIQNDWMGIDDPYDFDDYDATNPQPANYPSRLLAPVAPMVSSTPTPARFPTPVPMAPSEPTEAACQDSSRIGQNGMVGIGCYEQGYGTDRIVYDPPSMNVAVEEPSQLTLSHNPNLLLSDLLDPAFFQPQVKKRKRSGQDNKGENRDFFPLKRQKKQAMIAAPRSEKRLPRGSAGQSGIYTDLGEDAVPIEADEGLISAYSHAPYSHKSKVVNREDGLEVAAQAINNFGKTPAKRGRPRKRGHPRGKATEHDANPIKTPRRSARLQRKEADKSGADVSVNEPAQRPRKRQIDTLSGGRTAFYSDIDGDNDSLFGDPVMRENRAAKKAVVVRLSSQDENSPNPQLESGGAETGGDLPRKPIIKRRGRPPKQQKNAPDKPTPKRRGRPPKKAVAPLGLQSPSPAYKSAVSEKLSLQERLALKGKSFRIVSKAQKSTEAARGSAISVRITPSTMPGSATMPKSVPEQPSIVIRIAPNRNFSKAAPDFTRSKPSPCLYTFRMTAGSSIDRDSAATSMASFSPGNIPVRYPATGDLALHNRGNGRQEEHRPAPGRSGNIYHL